MLAAFPLLAPFIKPLAVPQAANGIINLITFSEQH
jgi:hypothetical protein